MGPEGMKSAYRWIFENLEHGGIFLLQDRVRVEDERVFPLYQRLWQKVDALNHTDLAAHEGDNYEEHIRRTLTGSWLAPLSPDCHDS